MPISHALRWNDEIQANLPVVKRRSFLLSDNCEGHFGFECRAMLPALFVHVISLAEPCLSGFLLRHNTNHQMKAQIQ